tara:strand:+ start:1653 stop:1976 length:324 start_codon:yes stop_codon:yes gene_type:complete
MSLKNMKLKFLAGVGQKLRAEHARRQGPPPQNKGAKTAEGQLTGIEYRTTGSATEIEEWLEANAKGKCIVGIEEMDDQHHVKTLKILFELEEDKAIFLAEYSGKKTF